MFSEFDAIDNHHKVTHMDFKLVPISSDCLTVILSAAIGASTLSAAAKKHSVFEAECCFRWDGLLLLCDR